MLPTSAQTVRTKNCFVVDEEHRRRGVASTGLKGALASVRKKGGGLVEASYMYSGTVRMFEKAGFKTAAPLATGRTATVVMRNKI